MFSVIAFLNSQAREMIQTSNGFGRMFFRDASSRPSSRGSSLRVLPSSHMPLDGTIAIRNKTIKKVTTDIHKCQFNTAVAALMEYINELYKQGATKDDLITLAKLLKPFAPHLASEILEKLGADDEWPTWDDKYLTEDTVELIVQINGKLRAKLTVSTDDLEDEEKIITLAKNNEKLQKYLNDSIKKTIYVKKAKLLNLVV